MKKLILFFCACMLLSCKKDSASINNEDITNVKWVLKTAVVDRPLPTSNGGVTTDYIAINGSQSCLGSNYTLTFLSDGTYQFSSTGALCDMIANQKNQIWTRENADTIILNKGSGREITITLAGNKLTYILANTPGVVYWAVLYTFKAKSK